MICATAIMSLAARSRSGNGSPNNVSNNSRFMYVGQSNTAPRRQLQSKIAFS